MATPKQKRASVRDIALVASCTNKSSTDVIDAFDRIIGELENKINQVTILKTELAKLKAN